MCRLRDEDADDEQHAQTFYLSFGDAASFSAAAVAVALPSSLVRIH